MNLAVVGTQWGDEGKGKIVDYLAPHFDVAVRYNGGNNAGHSVETETGQRKKVHLLPAAVFRGNCTCILGRGMVIDPVALVKEIRLVRSDLGREPSLIIDQGAHIILPHHREADARRENTTDRPLGTTKSGNGPAYADKMNRQSMRMMDLLRPDYVIEDVLSEAARGYPLPVTAGDVVETLLECGEFLAPYIQDAGRELNLQMREGRRVLFVGAHGAMLDIDHGTYPFVTSSTCTAAGVSTVGIDPRKVHVVLGVTKAYCTRIGTGPFPSEITGDLADHIREVGKEYGTTTGRPRRIGWLDIVALKHAIEINGIDVLSLSMMDVLGGIKKLKVITSYEPLEHSYIQPLAYGATPACGKILELSGWDLSPEEFREIKSYNALPDAVRNYVRIIEELTGVRVGLISTGPRRDQIIDRKIM